jgi:pSer/pThr/pTyr-binding forkhead associated (FHA) protein
MSDFQPGIRIGRDPACDLVVDDPYISKFHARVVLDHGALAIEDEGSINGTWVNGLRVWRHLLNAGTDRIRLGHTEWTASELIDAIRGRFDHV